MNNFQLESKFASINESINKLSFYVGVSSQKYIFSFLSVLRFSNFLKGSDFQLKKFCFFKKYLILLFLDLLWL